DGCANQHIGRDASLQQRAHRADLKRSPRSTAGEDESGVAIPLWRASRGSMVHRLLAIARPPVVQEVMFLLPPVHVPPMRNAVPSYRFYRPALIGWLGSLASPISPGCWPPCAFAGVSHDLINGTSFRKKVRIRMMTAMTSAVQKAAWMLTSSASL